MRTRWLTLRHGTASYIIVTAMWASEKSRMFYTRVKWQLERELLSLGLPRLVILRPSLLLGEREGESFGYRATDTIFRLIDPLLLGPLARMKAIPAKVVAQAMVMMAHEGEAAVEALESEVISLKIFKKKGNHIVTKKKSSIAVVAGATGLVGLQLVKLLLNHPAYSRVIVFVRRDLGISHPKLAQRIISYDRFEEELDEATMKNAHVFCALGTTIRQAGSQAAFRQVDYTYPLVLGKQAKKYGAAKLVIVTAMGSSAQSKLFYNRVKGELERDLMALDLPKLVIVRPSFMLGNRKEKRLGERVGIMAFQLLRPLMVGSLSQYRAVQSGDVAQVMVDAACRNTPKLEIIESNEISLKASQLKA